MLFLEIILWKGASRFNGAGGSVLMGCGGFEKNRRISAGAPVDINTLSNKRHLKAIKRKTKNIWIYLNLIVPYIFCIFRNFSLQLLLYAYIGCRVSNLNIPIDKKSIWISFLGRPYSIQLTTILPPVFLSCMPYMYNLISICIKKRHIEVGSFFYIRNLVVM